MRDTTLVIMAAGIGSRFGGGIKQLAPVVPGGEIIMDYSIHDALEAGFNKIIFIIRKDLEKDFKEIIGNRKNLVKWQDEFWQHMVKQYPELERGESASQTGREHIPPRIFKEMTQLTKQKEQLDALLVGINPFNGESRAAEISKVLDSYIPNVARMRDQLRKYNVAFTKTAAENEKLKEKNKTLSASLDKAKEGSVLKRLEDAKLRQDYEAAVGTLESIPPEVIQFYQNGGQIRGNNTEQEVNPHEEHRS